LLGNYSDDYFEKVPLTDEAREFADKYITTHIFQTSEIVLWTFIGFGLMGVNLVFAHKLAEMFDKRGK
jgi:hypothetical protein